MNSSKTTLGVLAAAQGAALLSGAFLVPVAAGGTAPLLMYADVGGPTLRALFALQGLGSLIFAALVWRDPRGARETFRAGLGWDVICQFSGLGAGHPAALAWLAVDAALTIGLLRLDAAERAVPERPGPQRRSRPVTVRPRRPVPVRVAASAPLRRTACAA